jgi:hypothetical protein
VCGTTWEEVAVDCVWHCISSMPDCYCLIRLFSVSGSIGGLDGIFHFCTGFMHGWLQAFATNFFQPNFRCCSS